MDEFQNWVLGHSVTLAALALLLFNASLALVTKNKRLIFGSIALICFWGMSIGTVMLARHKDIEYFSLLIDASGAALFYRLAERDRNTGERHDWAGLICLCYVWLVVVDLQRILFGNFIPNLYLATSNLVFALKVIVNIVPSIGLLLNGRKILIAGPR